MLVLLHVHVLHDLCFWRMLAGCAVHAALQVYVLASAQGGGAIRVLVSLSTRQQVCCAMSSVLLGSCVCDERLRILLLSMLAAACKCP